MRRESRSEALSGARFHVRDPRRVSNSRLALELSELARDAGRHDGFSDLVYRACFVEGRNIGDGAVLRDLAARAGLGAPAVERCLRERTHRSRVDRNILDSGELLVSGVPTFFVADGGPLDAFETPRIVGVQGRESFRRALAGTAGEPVGQKTLISPT